MQGDPFFLNLFESSVLKIFQKLDWKGKGVKINGRWYLRFADDVVLISSNIDELNVVADELCKESRKARITIN